MLDTLTEDQIIKRLENKTSHTFDAPLQIHQSEHKSASVLIPFVRIDDTWHLVFIRRSESENDRHSGQVAFAGGKAESYDDSEVATALRETEEEIGVKPADVNIWGQLSYHYSISNFQIAPVVASIPWPYQFTPDPSEVSHTFTLPLSWLADDKNYQIKQRKLDALGNQTPVIYYEKYNDELLWGATARMVHSLVTVLKQA